MSMTTESPEATNAQDSLPVPTWTPRATDRCDRCTSRAYTRAKKDELELFFCAHHTRDYESSLITSGWELQIRLDILESEVHKQKTVSDD